MRVTYLDTAVSGTTAATAVDAQAGSDDDRVLCKIMVGKPVAGASIVVYHNNNAYFGATTNIAFKYTYPTFAAGTPASDQFDFTSNSVKGSNVSGMILQGSGSFTTSSAMQVSLLWDNPEA